MRGVSVLVLMVEAALKKWLFFWQDRAGLAQLKPRQAGHE